LERPAALPDDHARADWDRVAPRQARYTPSWRHILVAIAATVALTLLGIWVRAHFPRLGFLFMYVPVIAALAYAGGVAAGLVAALLSVLLAWYFLVPPMSSFAVLDVWAPTLLLFTLAAFATAMGFGFARDIDEKRRQGERARLRLGAIVESSDDAIFSESLDGVILTWNAGAERLYGYAPAEAIGRHVSMLAPPEHPDEIPAILARIRRGEAIQHYETVRVRKDGTRLDVSVTLSPVRDASGTVIGASAVGRDISDRKRAERGQRFLAEASAVLAGSLDVEATLEALAHLVVPALADWCTIHLVQDDGRLGRLVIVHRDSAKVALARELEQRYPPDPRSPYGVWSVMRGGTPRLYSEITEDLLAAAAPDPELRRRVRELGLRSAMLVPLVAGRRPLGAISFVAAESGRRYDAADLALAADLAHRAALAVENARLHEAERAQRRAAEQAAQRVARLQRVTAAFSEALTPQEVAGVILAQGIGALEAQAGAVYVLGADGVSLEMLRHIDYPDELVRQRRYVPLSAPVPAAEAATTGRAIYAESRDEILGQYPALRGEMHPHPGGRAHAPMVVNGRPVGTLVFIFQAPRVFEAADREFIQALAAQCAQALERAQLYAREHRVAATLQEALLPTALPQPPGMRLAAAYRAGTPGSDVGGDWYDAFQLPDGRVVVAIGDVVGRGLRAAVTMGQIRQTIRAAALDGSPPGEVLARTSRILRLVHPGEEMTTAIVGVLDPLAAAFTYAAAGHPAPLLATEGGVETLPSGGLPLGFMEEHPAPCWRVELAPGALLVLYTDGLIEPRRDPVAGLAALRSAVAQEWHDRTARPAQALLDRLELEVEEAPDDIALITVTVESRPVDRLELTLPAEPASLRLVRQALRRLSRDLGLDDHRAFALAVAVGEAVNNAIEHAYGVAAGPVAVRAWREGEALRVEVADQGRWRPDRPETHGGRGLAVMRALAEALEVVTAPHGTTVRFSLPLAAPPRAAEPPADTPVGEADAVVRKIERIEAAADARRSAGEDEWTVRLLGGVPVIEVGGDVDLAAIGRFTAAVERAAEASQGAVVLSAGGTAYFDSQSIQALFQVGKRLQTSRRALLVAVPPLSPLRQLLDVVGLGTVFPMFGSVDQAVAAALASDAAR